MCILGVEFCDFIVYAKCSPPSLVVVKIKINLEFCEILIRKCEQSFKKNVLKELITRELENQTCELPGDDSCTQPDAVDVEKTWCISTETECGRMVKCDNEDCRYQWFHYKCVNIRRKPKDSGSVTVVRSDDKRFKCL